MTVNIHEAKSQLSRLIDRAMAGEEVIIAKAGKPIVKLTAIATSKQREFGFARHLVSETPGWERPLTDAEVDELFGTGL